MRRLVARFFFVFIVGSIAMVLGVVTSMTLTPRDGRCWHAPCRGCSTRSSSVR